MIEQLNGVITRVRVWKRWRHSPRPASPIMGVRLGTMVRVTPYANPPVSGRSRVVQHLWAHGIMADGLRNVRPYDHFMPFRGRHL